MLNISASASVGFRAYALELRSNCQCLLPCAVLAPFAASVSPSKPCRRPRAQRNCGSQSIIKPAVRLILVVLEVVVVVVLVLVPVLSSVNPAAETPNLAINTTSPPPLLTTTLLLVPFLLPPPSVFSLVTLALRCCVGCIDVSVTR